MHFLNQLARVPRISDDILKNVFHVDLFSRTEILREDSKRTQRVKKFANLRNFISTKTYPLS